MQVLICISADPRLPRLRDRFGFLLRVIRPRGQNTVQVTMAMLIGLPSLSSLGYAAQFDVVCCGFNQQVGHVQIQRVVGAMSSATALGREAT